MHLSLDDTETMEIHQCKCHLQVWQSHKNKKGLKLPWMALPLGKERLLCFTGYYFFHNSFSICLCNQNWSCYLYFTVFRARIFFSSPELQLNYSCLTASEPASDCRVTVLSHCSDKGFALQSWLAWAWVLDLSYVQTYGDDDMLIHPWIIKVNS